MARRRRSMMDGFDVGINKDFGNIPMPKTNRSMNVDLGFGAMNTGNIGFNQDAFDSLDDDVEAPQLISQNFDDEPDIGAAFGEGQRSTVDVAGGFGSLNPTRSPLDDEEAELRGGNYRANSRLVKRRGLRGKFEDTRFKQLTQGASPLNPLEEQNFKLGRTYLGGGT